MTVRTQDFRPEPRSVAAARRFAKDVLRSEPKTSLEAIELMVSELATNSIRHAHSGFRITIERTGREVRIEVTDSSGARPQMRSPGPEEPNGRGLRIVEMLADAWGVRGGAPDGKTVWFTVSRPGG